MRINGNRECFLLLLSPSKCGGEIVQGDLLRFWDSFPMLSSDFSLFHLKRAYLEKSRGMNG